MKGATKDYDDMGLTAKISIHAPVKGATGDTLTTLREMEISIHAPVKGATFSCVSPLGSGIISIHAPVKGATGGSPIRRDASPDFNPRSREGSDVHANAAKARDLNFNPRSREGSDEHHDDCVHDNAISIHAPVKGATRLLAMRLKPLRISIHAPVKGATTP